MIGLVLVTHGRLADEFRNAVEHVVGPQEAFETISIGPEDDMEQRRTDIVEAVGRADRGKGVIILTDMFGGTPCNVAITFMEPGKVEIVTGVNLPMVVRLGCLLKQEMGLSEVAYWLQEKGRRSVCVASDRPREGVWCNHASGHGVLSLSRQVDVEVADVRGHGVLPGGVVFGELEAI